MLAYAPPKNGSFLGQVRLGPRLGQLQDWDTGVYPIPGPQVPLSVRTQRTLNALFKLTEPKWWQWVNAFKTLMGAQWSNWSDWDGYALVFFDTWDMTMPKRWAPKDFFSIIRRDEMITQYLPDFIVSNLLTKNADKLQTVRNIPSAFLKDAMWIVDRLTLIINIVQNKEMSQEDKKIAMADLNVSNNDFDLSTEEAEDKFNNDVVYPRDNVLAEIVVFNKLGYPPSGYQSPFASFSQSLAKSSMEWVEFVKKNWPWFAVGGVVLFVGLPIALKIL